MKSLRNDPALKQRRKDLRHNETAAEQVFWSCVREKQFLGLKFFRQYSVGPYILDFYCPALKLAVELDGNQHDDFDNNAYDAERSAYLKSQGIQVMRFWNHEILSDMGKVLAKIKSSSPLPPS
jgi:very-short-patch-repair endonuclease